MESSTSSDFWKPGRMKRLAGGGMQESLVVCFEIVDFSSICVASKEDKVGSSRNSHFHTISHDAKIYLYQS